MLKNYGLCGSLSNIELLQGKKTANLNKPGNLQSEIREPCEIIETKLMQKHLLRVSLTELHTEKYPATQPA